MFCFYKDRDSSLLRVYYYYVRPLLGVRITGVVGWSPHLVTDINQLEAARPTETLHKALERNGEHGLSISAKSTIAKQFAKPSSPC